MVQPVLLPALLPVVVTPLMPLWWVLVGLGLCFLWIGFVWWRAYLFLDAPRREAARKKDDRG